MPTYEYECSGCQDIHEIFQHMTDEPLTQCADSGAPMKRRISRGGGFIFKGSGFYATDYRSASYQERAKADTPSDKSDQSTGKTDQPSTPPSTPKKPPSTTDASSTEGSGSSSDSNPKQGPTPRE